MSAKKEKKVKIFWLHYQDEDEEVAVSDHAAIKFNVTTGEARIYLSNGDFANSFSLESINSSKKKVKKNK